VNNLIEELVVISLILLFFGVSSFFAHQAEKYLDQLAVKKQENKNTNSKNNKSRK
jgi:hypothetical protein